ncbi:MAG: FHIPEP family type III secretion protein, partial [Planctomycetaceae bacterium]|nr:FHIPEP family type III secretion protein [Planctomycetaceae bacterium]
EFYGAMDGASKFVRGDAVAGLIITGVNLVGGVILGVSNGHSFMDSIRMYSILTVGDGLVSQIPALIIATTAGVLVTKTTSTESLGDEIRTQMFTSSRPIWIGAGILAVIALMPGLPRLPFLSIAAGLVLLAGRVKPAPEDPAAPESPEGGDDPDGVVSEQKNLDEFLLSDRAVVEVGARLVPFIQSRRVKGLSDRITALRREFSRSTGLWVPPIRVNSNLLLQPEEYRILIAGRRVAGAEIRSEQLMAILPEGRNVSIPGEPTTEPAFGLAALWIVNESRRAAEVQGCTVVDPLSVLITHLGEILKKNAHELLTRESLKMILDRAREFAPTIVDEIKPEIIRMGTLHQVLTQLAEERVPLADIALILESIVNHAPTTKTPEELTDRVRIDLGRLVCERFRAEDGRLRVIMLEQKLDTRLRQSLQQEQLGIGPLPMTRLIEQVSAAWQESERRHQPVAMLADRSLRRPLRKLLARSVPDLGLIAYQEVPADLIIDTVQTVSHDAVMGSDQAEDLARQPEATATRGAA